MSYEITVITPDGTPSPPRRVDAAAVRTVLDQAAADGRQLRIRPVTPAAAPPLYGTTPEPIPAAEPPQ